MQKMMGLVRRCIEDYNMIEAGDRVAVGVSGGTGPLDAQGAVHLRHLRQSTGLYRRLRHGDQI